MEESDLQGNRTLLTQIECLQLPVGSPVPNMEGAAVVTWDTNNSERCRRELDIVVGSYRTMC